MRFKALLVASVFALASPAFAQGDGGGVPASPTGDGPPPGHPGHAATPAGTPPTSGQAPDTGSSAPKLQEVVVTAQRRSENLQNVPIAVSAVTSSQLAKTGVRDIVDLKLAVPTLNLTNSNGYLTTSLRGVGSNAIGPGIENPVATYIDGVYYGSPASSLLTLNNVAQVEVLKGPQGTLFGRNATAGLIQVTTRDPTATPHGDFGVSYGNYSTVNATAYLTGGVDHAATDVALSFTHQGEGYGKDIYNGKDVYQLDRDFAIRSKTILTPVDGTKITVIGDYEKGKNTDNALTALGGTISGFAPNLGVIPDRGYDVDTDSISSNQTWSGGVSVRIDQKLGALSLISTTAYRQDQSQLAFDYDGTQEMLETIDYTQRDHQLTQELQLTSPSGKRFTWVAGAFYYDAAGGYFPTMLNFYDQGEIITIRATQHINSVAGYGQGTYELFDQTHLTFGARFTTESRNLVSGGDAFVIPIGLTAPIVAPERVATFTKPTFRVSLDHRFSPELLAYVSYNTGFKSGGFNTSQPGSNPYQPETLDAYEIGFKADLLDRRLRLNAAGYYYKYDDVQVQLVEQATIGIVNGASADIYGLDLDAQALVTNHLTLSGGLGLTHPNFDSFPICQISTPIGGTPIVNGSCNGHQLPLASKVLGNIQADYHTDVFDGVLDLNANVYYNDGFFTESDNVYRQPSYAQVGSSIRWTAPDRRTSITLYGKNLNDARVISFETTVDNGTHLGFYQAPRTFGVSVGYKF